MKKKFGDEIFWGLFLSYFFLPTEVYRKFLWSPAETWSSLRTPLITTINNSDYNFTEMYDAEKNIGGEKNQESKQKRRQNSRQNSKGTKDKVKRRESKRRRPD